MVIFQGMEIIQTMNSDPGLAVGRSIFKTARISHNHYLFFTILSV